MELLDILKISPLFSSLSKNIQWRISALAQIKSFEKGDYLCHQGDQGDYCYIVKSGKVEVFFETASNKKIHISDVGIGDILGELSLIDGLPRSASMIAIEPTETFAIASLDFQMQLQSYPEIALQLLPVITKRLRQAQEQLIKRVDND
ncbi:MlotiK1 channel [Legionella massiliensis]|uniref:MlotiK1 channel n=1 Tax=Legionella massiliensis TaxID=1034943 RepID=A0A078KWZ5_9GAMM|nr:cyclic nucleotide-binding domain-containing protein [Legionella massiliensis]CDZ77552.1 MlotiK1 channel [Legionella massiliensis]CEE13290.1 Cyclic nucleotide-gated potassium channel [Legionella massiliensis]